MLPSPYTKAYASRDWKAIINVSNGGRNRGCLPRKSYAPYFLWSCDITKYRKIKNATFITFFIDNLITEPRGREFLAFLMSLVALL